MEGFFDSGIPIRKGKGRLSSLIPTEDKIQIESKKLRIPKDALDKVNFLQSRGHILSDCFILGINQLYDEYIRRATYLKVQGCIEVYAMIRRKDNGDMCFSRLTLKAPRNKRTRFIIIHIFEMEYIGKTRRKLHDDVLIRYTMPDAEGAKATTMFEMIKKITLIDAEIIKFFAEEVEDEDAD